MFLKVKTVTALADMKLSVEFAEGVTKIYDVSPLLGRLPVFRLLEEWDLFEGVEVDAGGYGIVWNDDLDLSCNAMQTLGTCVKTRAPFRGVQ